MKKIALILFLIAISVFAGNLFAQTNPTAFDLTTGSYTLTSWASTNPAGTFPPNMAFHKTAILDPLITTEPNGDYAGVFSGTSATRMNGLADSGFSFVNTSSTNSGGGWLGAAVLAINTTNRTNINVAWHGGFVALTGTASREYRITLQYRVGTTNTYQNVLDTNGNNVEYIVPAYPSTVSASSIPATTKFFSVNLPLAA